MTTFEAFNLFHNSTVTYFSIVTNRQLAYSGVRL